ncbi:MAG: transposase [Saprospiraceae bacterium]|nr:transposase [Saprospiraceae bacterium]
MAKHKKYSPSFKAKVVLESMKEQKTMAELSSEYQVAASQISQWKQKLMSGASQLFESSNEAEEALAALRAKEALLYQEIGIFG